MNYNTIKYFCTTNGDGVRTALFVSGCEFHCKGCFNSVAWDFNYGKEFTDETIDKILESIEPDYIAGLSILGGEPLNPKNVKDVTNLLKKFRDKFGDTKDVWMWSGYYYNEIQADILKFEAIKYVDHLVDGRFEQDKSIPGLKLRGSTNQHILTLKDGKIIKSEN